MDEYNKDPRAACKYGANCYQKNPNHKSKFKHPPQEESDESSPEQPAKRFKKDDTHTNAEDSDSTTLAKDTSDATAKGDTSRTVTDVREKETKKKADQKSEEATSADNGKEDAEDEKKSEDSEEDLPPSPSDVKLSIKQKFLLEMPEDFYSFWEFCKSLSQEKPEQALKDIRLSLAGPYDVLSGKISRSSKPRTQSRFLRHWRFYYDPPEFQTVLVQNGDKLFHIGYFRDDPEEMPCFLASNCASKDGTLTPMGPNIFSAVNCYIEDYKNSADPFAKIKISKIQKSLQAWANKEEHDLNKLTSNMKERTRKTVCKTFHGAGLVVPYNRKSDIGYRPLIETNVNLKRILNKVESAKNAEQREDALEELHPIVNAAHIANDECDFGTSIELGLDLFTFGVKEVEPSALHLLTAGYSLINRKLFAEIVKAHLKHRKKGDSVDMFP